MLKIGLFQKALNELEKKFGSFDLFALFLREESPGVWDLVVSSSWLGEGRLAKLREFADVLKSVIGEEVIQLSRIVPLNKEDESLQQILRVVGNIDGIKEIRDQTFNQVEVERGYVLKANADLLHTAHV